MSPIRGFTTGMAMILHGSDEKGPEGNGTPKKRGEKEQENLGTNRKLDFSLNRR